VHPFGALPGDFVGLSYEMRELSTQCTTGVCAGGFDAGRGNLVALMRNLGRSNVRIAGNQLDRDTLWVPAGQTPPDPLPAWVKDVVTPTDIARLDRLLRATGWKAEVGINLAHYDPALAADEAQFQLYTPICAATEQNLSTKIFTAMPEYYGLYMATRMGSGRFLPVTVSADQNITAYAVRGDDGRLRIAVIDKDATSAAPVPISVNVGGTARDASVLRLTGRSLDSADGVTVQGRAVDRAGRLDPGPAGQVPVHHGTVRLTMASGSALVLTLDGRA
jgi:hypothetical protein